MYKFTAFMLQIAAVIVFLISLFPFSLWSIAGVLFSISLFSLGIEMWRKGSTGYCEWVSDEDIEGWDWERKDQEFRRFDWNEDE